MNPAAGILAEAIAAIWAETPVFETFLAGAGLLLAVVGLGAGVLIIRRRLLARRSGAEQATFDSETLEGLRRGGQISEQEYRRLRRIMLGLDRPGREADNVPVAGRDAFLTDAAENDDCRNGPRNGPRADGKE